MVEPTHLKNMIVKIVPSSPIFEVKKKYLSCHHLENYYNKMLPHPEIIHKLPSFGGVSTEFPTPSSPKTSSLVGSKIPPPLVLRMFSAKLHPRSVPSNRPRRKTSSNQPFFRGYLGLLHCSPSQFFSENEGFFRDSLLKM